MNQCQECDGAGSLLMPEDGVLNRHPEGFVSAIYMNELLGTGQTMIEANGYFHINAGTKRDIVDGKTHKMVCDACSGTGEQSA